MQFKSGGGSQVGVIHRHFGLIVPEAGSVLWSTCNSTFLNQFHNAVNQDHGDRRKPHESKNHLDYSLLFQAKYGKWNDDCTKQEQGKVIGMQT